MFPCWFKEVLGVECLGCGIQRATLLLWDGNWKASFQQYPALIPMMVLLLLFGINYGYKNKKLKLLLQFWTFICFAIILISYFGKRLNYV